MADILGLVAKLPPPHTIWGLCVAVDSKVKFYTNADYDITFWNMAQIPTEVLKYELRKLQIKVAEESRSNYLTFVKKVWPDFIAGSHHKIFAKKLEDVSRGKIKRLIVNMPPRHTKSEFASNLFPAWMMGKNPKLKIIQTTHTAELSYNFGRKVRNLFEQDEFKEVFPDVTLS